MVIDNKKQAGFTLVELAIVLMIIGLLIGGILRGQELMNNARLQNITKQITSYTAAVTTFRDAYSSYPGDMPTATARIPGCQTASNNCSNGNGNGVMGDIGLVWLLGDQGVTSENFQFWKHLALAHLISGVRPNAATPEFGISHPSVPIGGGLSIRTTTKDPGDPNGSAFDGAMVLRLHGDLSNNIIEENAVVTPHQASYIDRKMDDGVPITGDVQSTGAGSAGVHEADCEGMAYAETSEIRACTMAFLINR